MPVIAGLLPLLVSEAFALGMLVQEIAYLGCFFNVSQHDSRAPSVVGVLDSNDYIGNSAHLLEHELLNVYVTYRPERNLLGVSGD